MSATSFNVQLDRHGAWRLESARRLSRLSAWLADRELLDAAVAGRLHRLQEQLRSDKVTVAFIAEFSRGKSELINAIFFGNHKRRILPASAGRTTMCPIELGYDAKFPSCLRLLPIETRLLPQSLLEWRLAPEKWTRIDLDANDSGQLAQALEKVTELRRVTPEEARALGFWLDEASQHSPRVDGDGLLEVPRWRHALLNIEHPLLRQGLVILDTPGLNAVGTEPELTVNLIAQAHVVVFVLAADAGVTKSDLAVWREHLGGEVGGTRSRFVVLNKIDSLWDSLSTPEQTEAQLERQRAASAETLGVPLPQVIPVSAQKGLAAKVMGNDALLAASRLPALELALSHSLLGRRQQILRSAVAGGIAELHSEAHRIFEVRRRDLAEQMLELRDLRGKNTTAIHHMRARIEQEQAAFEASGARIHALRSAHLRLLREVFRLLDNRALKAEMQELGNALRQPGIKLGVRKVYARTFARLRENLQRVQAINTEIQAMLHGSFGQLNVEYGFTLQAPEAPDLGHYMSELELLERGHDRYLGLGNLLKLAQPGFAERLARALATQLRVVYESALGEVELWNKSAAARLDAQLRERRGNFNRRLGAIGRIQQAAGSLDQRIAEISASGADLSELEAGLRELAAHLADVPLSPDGTPAASAPRTEPAQPARHSA